MLRAVGKHSPASSTFDIGSNGYGDRQSNGYGDRQLVTQAIGYKGASNGGYHYFGSAKIFAQMGKAFAEPNLKMMK